MSNLFINCPECGTPNPKQADSNPPFTCFNCNHEFIHETLSDVNFAAYNLITKNDRNRELTRLDDLFKLIDRAYNLGMRDAQEKLVDAEYEQLCTNTSS